MKMQQYQALSNKVDSFISLFEKVPIPNSTQSIAWEHFYHNYFNSLSCTVVNCIFHLDYAKARTHIKSPEHTHTITLHFDSQDRLIRHLGLDLQKQPHHSLLLNDIKNKLVFFRLFKKQDSYTQFNCNLLKGSNENENFLVTGFINQNSKTKSITIHLVAIQLDNNNNNSDSFYPATQTPFNIEKNLKAFIEQDKHKAIQDLCIKLSMSKEELDQHFLDNYGVDIPTAFEKERILKCVEQILFSDLDLQKIARNYSFESWHELNEILQETIPLQLIRYNPKQVSNN